MTRRQRADVALLFGGRTLRAFGFGFGAVLIGIHLQDRGGSPQAVGVVLAIAVLSAALLGLPAAATSRRLGRRATLCGVGLLMCVSGLLLSQGPPALLPLAALTGMMGPAGTDLGPFLAVEQAVLAETAEPSRRNRAFARYSLAGGLAGAAGGLAAGAAGPGGIATQTFFVIYAVLGLLTAVLPLGLSKAVEGRPVGPVFGEFRPLLGLSALFALDALGGGLVVNSVLVYWLHIRFGASPDVLGPAFGLMSLLAALSFEVSGRLADRIGLVNTMVFTHLPTSLLLLLIPFVPGLGWALGLLLVRAALQSMDVPARQAYIVSIVDPSTRSGALAMVGAVRGVAQALGPLITGVAIQAAALGLPFFVAGITKGSYDVALFAAFRSRRGDHEEVRDAPSAR